MSDQDADRRDRGFEVEDVGSAEAANQKHAAPYHRGQRNSIATPDRQPAKTNHRARPLRRRCEKHSNASTLNSR